MRYALDVVVPAATTEEAAFTRKVSLNVGKITQCLIHFHNGAHWLVSVRMLDGLFQFVPASGTGWITGNNETVVIPMDYDLAYGDTEITLIAKSPDCEFDHALEIYIDLEQNASLIKQQFLSASEFMTEVNR